MKNFPSIEASIGGQISIDIYEKGKNKAQVLETSSGRVNFYVRLFTLYPLRQLLTIFDIYNFSINLEIC